MPILHVQYDAETQADDGKAISLPAPVVLRKHGPFVQIVVGIGQSFAEQLLQQGLSLPSPISGNALIDTGASTTCVDDTVAKRMGLPVLDVVNISSASHPSTRQNVYSVQMEIVGSPIRLEISNAIGAALAPQGLIALIGRDYLQHCTLHYNGLTGEITLAI